MIKEPNRELYDLGDKVKLTCTLDNSNGKVGRIDIKHYYTLEWYQNSTKMINNFYGPNYEKIIMLDSLTQETKGTYKCVIHRSIVNYYDFKLVSIRLKGKPI